MTRKGLFEGDRKKRCQGGAGKVGAESTWDREEANMEPGEEG